MRASDDECENLEITTTYMTNKQRESSEIKQPNNKAHPYFVDCLQSLDVAHTRSCLETLPGKKLSVPDGQDTDHPRRRRCLG